MITVDFFRDFFRDSKNAGWGDKVNAKRCIQYSRDYLSKRPNQSLLNYQLGGNNVHFSYLSCFCASE